MRYPCAAHCPDGGGFIVPPDVLEEAARLNPCTCNVRPKDWTDEMVEMERRATTINWRGRPKEGATR